MAKERCPACRATLPVAAVYCPTCGRASAPVLLDDVEFAPAEATTVELGGGPRRWLLPVAAVAVLAAIVVGLSVSGSGEETLTADTVPVTSTTTRPITPTTTPTRPPTTTTTEPAVETYGALVGEPSGGRRIAVLGGGEIREIDLDTGLATIVARDVVGDMLAPIDGGYVVLNGGVIEIYADGAQVLDYRGTGGPQLLGVADGAAVLVEWLAESGVVRMARVDGSVTDGPTMPTGLWPVGASEAGVVATSDSHGHYLVSWDGSVRRLTSGKVIGLWPGGFHAVVCDDAFVCSIESRSMEGQLVATGSGTEIGCCWWQLYSGIAEVAIVGRDGQNTIVQLGDTASPVTVLDSSYSYVSPWPDGQWLLLFDGARMVAWSQAERRVIEIERPVGTQILAVSAIA